MPNRGPTLINHEQVEADRGDYIVPPPPSDPATPSEMGPGTPNSTTTSLSALSVVAIKDGAMGHGGRGAATSANTLEAERADRISRLAGLERVATSRPTPLGHLAPGSGAYGPGFDNVPQFKERSTVGSASATGSVGGRTTWASGSIDYDADKMSEDQDDGVSSTGGFSDEDKASLVGFGEGAGSTVSGPVSTPYNTRASGSRAGANANVPSTPRTGTVPTFGSGQSTPMSGITPSAAAGSTDPKMMDGMSYDQNIIDTTMQPAPPVDLPSQGNRFSGFGTEMAEGIMRDRLADLDHPQHPLGTADGQILGKFPFEKE
ncbi:uncharacterized protein Z518_10001 [Rhinocladiella mackenziei CBS 650.93]|uniref:Rhinocladiella mackenziei CBS 650.93 unplaced genomic scaffold supercont1.8, whole genome shotgun sequence n=1 Tax=Rhinocladiella mackenziei CBS 650.93 TaxID=1442369 RepID=A0A0D2ICF4_9EURO|nr:uncharacterized protein Z518_10001 [Rhinocladiella mackenziei CBS 650.93]KIX00936.1 hypothetical protein Z518_10001 [Rhinocladiella mackenziei CBS 650.93]